jgi:hypothetical protein
MIKGEGDVRRVGEGEALWFLGNLVTVKATGADTRERLTVVEFVNPPGFAHRCTGTSPRTNYSTCSPAPHCSGATTRSSLPGPVTSSCYR